MISLGGIVAITGSRILDEGDHAIIRRTMQDLCWRMDYGTIYFGGAIGADTEALVHARSAHPIPALVVVVPGRLCEQTAYAAKQVHRCADDVIELRHPVTDRQRYRKRNQYMVDRADRLLAFSDGNEQSGTAMTMRMAEKKGIPIHVVRIRGGAT